MAERQVHHTSIQTHISQCLCIQQVLQPGNHQGFLAQTKGKRLSQNVSSQHLSAVRTKDTAEVNTAQTKLWNYVDWQTVHPIFETESSFSLITCSIAVVLELSHSLPHRMQFAKLSWKCWCSNFFNDFNDTSMTIGQFYLLRMIIGYNRKLQNNY